MAHVSVIMPNLNKGRFIATAIQSVLNQTYKDLELIVVDSGSTDDSISTIESLAKSDARVRLIVDRTKMGVSYARNRAMKEAQGRYQCFLDSDDIFRPERVQKMVEALRDNPKHVAFTDVFSIDEAGRTLRGTFIDRLPAEGDAYVSVLTKQMQGQHTVMVPSSALEVIGGFDESMTWGEDFDYLLRLTEEYRVVLVKQPLYGYRRYGASTSGTTPAKSKGRAYIKVLESNLGKNWDRLDGDAKFMTIVRIQEIARESNIVSKYMSWKVNPRYLRLALGITMQRFRGSK